MSSPILLFIVKLYLLIILVFKIGSKISNITYFYSIQLFEIWNSYLSLN